MANKATQHDRIRMYLKRYGSITPLEAFSELGITKLSTRISEMKRAGEHIETEVIYTKNRYGEPTHYCSYTLTDE